jgi:tetratricopeptide (TPR) repeat protein
MGTTDLLNDAPRCRQWPRIIRPLLWWLLLVAVLFAYHTHERLLEETRLTFLLRLENHPIPPDESIALIDNRQMRSGEKIPLGRHKLTFAHPKGKSYTTNLFIWYGMHDLGVINLPRGYGTLAIKSDRVAKLINVRGPDYSVILTNSTGTTSTVPADHYTIEAIYGHSRENGEEVVSDGAVVGHDFRLALGVAQLKCNQEGASFTLVGPDGQVFETGVLPCVIADLPEGSYSIVAVHHGNQVQQKFVVKSFATNEIRTEFSYGAANLETDPAGANVTTAQGQSLGNTPLHLSEILAGDYTFTLSKNGYDTLSATLRIKGNETSVFRTNLFSLNFARAMDSARNSLAGGNFDAALFSASDALAVNPNDPEALKVKNEAFGRRNIRKAEEEGKMGNYVSAIQLLEAALEALPDNPSAKQLLTDFQRQEREQAEKQSKDRLERPKAIFDSTLAKIKDADLFESHELTTSKAAMEVSAAIANQLRAVAPNFHITFSDKPTLEIFRIEAKEEFFGGVRSCVIVGGQTKTDETRILFKVLEYKTHHGVKLQGLNLAETTEHIPIHPSRIPDMTDKLKLQLEDGVKTVMERIQHATQ